MLEKNGLYQYLVGKKIPDLTDKVKLITLKKGELIYNTDQRFTDIYEIVSGAVKLGGISTKGEEYIYELVTHGEFFGNLAFLGDTFSEFSRTLADSQLYSYNVTFFKHLMTHDPVVSEWCFSRIVSRWNKTESILTHIRSYEPRERIQLLYTSLQKKIMTANNREVSLDKLITFKDAADLTATTRQLVADTIKSYQ